MTVAIRMRQGWRALWAWTQSLNETAAAQIVSPALLTLFQRMRRSERQHSLNVLRTLQEKGYRQPALLTAALLHDVGKTRARFYLWERVLVVLVNAAKPRLVLQWGQGKPLGWRRPFAISVQHPQWGAEMVEAAGADTLVIDLIAAHQKYLDYAPRTEFERLLAALQAADDAN